MSRSVPNTGKKGNVLPSQDVKEKVKDKGKKKKKTQYFLTYISKLIKDRYPNFSISGNAKDQINKLMVTFCETVSQACHKSLRKKDRKTINEDVVKNILELYLKDNLYRDCVFNGEQCLENLRDFNTFQKDTNDKRSRYTRKTVRAMITIPPPLVEKFLRSQSKVMLSSEVSTFFAGCVEYILTEILDVTVGRVISENKSRILIKHVEFGVDSHDELKGLIHVLNITFLGGPVHVGIHKELTLKEEGSNKFKGSVKDIKTLQKSNKLMIPKAQIERMIRKSLGEFKTGKNFNPVQKVSKNVFIITQYIIERKILDLLRKANIIALHGKRSKVTGSDISLALFLERSGSNFSLGEYYTFSDDYHFDVKSRKKRVKNEGEETIEENTVIEEIEGGTIEDGTVFEEDGTVIGETVIDEDTVISSSGEDN